MRVLTRRHCEVIVEVMLSNMERYVAEDDLQGMALGVSGGVDSAVMAVLATRLAEKLSRNGYPFKTSFWFLDVESDFDDYRKARELGQLLKVNISHKDLDPLYQTFLSELENLTDDHDGRVRKGNIKARLRMVFLRDVAQKIHGVVLDTGNWTEHIVGFWTIAGDEGDIGVLTSLTKAEILDLAEYLGVPQSILDSPPGDGLKVTAVGTAADQFGGLDHLYRDYIISRYIGEGFNPMGGWDQFELDKFFRLKLTVAVETICSLVGIQAVMGKVVATTFKRRTNRVINLMPTRVEVGLPVMGSDEFNQTYLKAIQNRWSTVYLKKV